MIDGLICLAEPPPNRKRKCDGDQEQHFPEAAIMLAFASHLLHTIPTVRDVSIYPDGEHAKRFDIRGWLIAQGFVQVEQIGTTAYGGIYRRNGQTIKVIPQSGEGDVVAVIDGKKIVAECKGGIINTRHPGQVSRLRRGLCEAIGLLMVRPIEERQIAVVPYTDTTLKLARKIIARTTAAGIEIALVEATGHVNLIS